MKKFGLSILPALLLGAAMAMPAEPIAAAACVGVCTYGLQGFGNSTPNLIFGQNDYVNVDTQVITLAHPNYLEVRSQTAGITFSIDDVTDGASSTFETIAGTTFFDLTQLGNSHLIFTDLTGADQVSFYNPGFALENSPPSSTLFLPGAVPEPSTWAMLLLGFAGLGFMAYRRKAGPVLMAA